MKKIKYVLANFPHLSETFVAREIIGIEKCGRDVEVFSLRPRRFSSPDAITVDGVDVSYSSFSLTKMCRNVVANLLTGNSLLFSWETVTDSISLLTRGKFSNAFRMLSVLISAETCIRPETKEKLKGENVHLHTHFLFSASYVIYRLSKLLDCSFSITLHTKSLTWMFPDQVAKVLNHSQFLNCNSKQLVEFIRSFGLRDLEKIHLVRNGINAGEVEFVPKAKLSNPVKLLGVGNLLDKKGFDDLVSCCDYLVKANTPFECTIVGEGPERTNLETQIAELKLDDKVRLLGRQPFTVVRKMLRESDIFLMPSKSPKKSTLDGLPTVIIESMATGTPVVSTNFAGIPDLVIDGKTGLLAEPGDPAGLASAVQKIVNDDELRNQLLHNAKQLVDLEYNNEKNIGRLLELMDA